MSGGESLEQWAFAGHTTSPWHIRRQVTNGLHHRVCATTHPDKLRVTKPQHGERAAGPAIGLSDQGTVPGRRTVPEWRTVGWWLADDQMTAVDEESSRALSRNCRRTK